MPPRDARSEFSVSTEVFLRLLAVIYAIAFVSFWVQLNGLIGPKGVLPAQVYLDAIANRAGTAARWTYLPTFCWWFGGGVFLHVLCALGVVLSVTAFFNVLRPLSLLGLWACYLSLAAPAQIFLNYQWDILLLEAGLLSFFLAAWKRGDSRPEPPRVARWLLWWLLIRLMLLSGIVKLGSGDPTWRNLTALTFHYETQPLPTWIGWWAHQLPVGFQKFSCAVMFIIELAAPLALIGLRRVRLVVILAQIALQAPIALTGNYTFFNLLIVALCVLFLDDAWWARWWGAAPAAQQRAPGVFVPWWLLQPVFWFVLVLTTTQALPSVSRTLTPPDWMLSACRSLGGYRSLNNYGLFAVMTTSRPEIVIEGSNDGRTWVAYEFPDKPGDLQRRPGFVAPHQPRLDWQLWFAALAYPQRERWVLNLMERLLQNEPAVLGLLKTNPFPNEPPRQIRAVLYDYKFTTPEVKAQHGNWWRRTPLDYYLPATSLR